MAIKSIKGNVDLQSRGRVTVRIRFHRGMSCDIKSNSSLIFRKRLFFGNNSFKSSIISFASLVLKHGISCKINSLINSNISYVLKKCVGLKGNSSVIFIVSPVLRNRVGIKSQITSSLICYEVLRISKRFNGQSNINSAIQFNLTRINALLNLPDKGQTHLYNADYYSQ